MKVESVKKNYRKGANGALMDEYERAAAELIFLVEKFSEDDFIRIVDSQTENEDCRSVQTIMSHVVRSGYAYADYIREGFSIAADSPQPELFSYRQIFSELEKMLEYTAQTLEGKWEMSTGEIRATILHTRSGVIYNLEQLLQHAIVHILRHRRQIEKFIAQGAITI